MKDIREEGNKRENKEEKGISEKRISEKGIRIEEVRERILGGGELTGEEALALAEIGPEQREELYAAAEAVTQKYCSRVFDTCSIVNARSGRCPEDCKWCAQSAHYKTSADVYPMIDEEECLRHADASRSCGIRRFSMVTSGRKMGGKELELACSHFRKIREEGGLDLCASMGLLTKEELLKLKEAGVTRYHCNLEAAPEHFSTLCSTHSVEDKIKTIQSAREIGMEVCSGGIIGMGETARQRVELALELRRVSPVSIPINVLCPIPGTPLEKMAPLSSEEILDTVALFRLIHPKATLRFAGGRGRIDRETQLRAIRMGVNGAIVGDLLTTIGSTVEADAQLVEEAGMTSPLKCNTRQIKH